MVSQYLHSRRAGYTDRSFNRVLREDSLYISISRYGMQLHKYLEQFSREQFLLLNFDELVTSPEKTLELVWSFLEVRPGSLPSKRAHNISTNRQTLSDNEIMFTRETYDYFLPIREDDLSALQRSTGFDATCWDISADRWVR